MKRSAAEFMQYRRPPLSRGPSGNTWPRWLSPCLERTSVRAMPCVRSTCSTMLAASMGRVKLGQPVPLSNLSKEANRGSPETTSTYSPGSLLSQYALANARSVPPVCVTRYCSGVRRDSASGLLLKVLIRDPPPGYWPGDQWQWRHGPMTDGRAIEMVDETAEPALHRPLDC